MLSELSRGVADEVLMMCDYWKDVFYDPIGFFKMASGEGDENLQAVPAKIFRN